MLMKGKLRAVGLNELFGCAYNESHDAGSMYSESKRGELLTAPSRIRATGNHDKQQKWISVLEADGLRCGFRLVKLKDSLPATTKLINYHFLHAVN